jgi:hypothetical protein
MDPYGKGRLIAFLDCCGTHLVACGGNPLRKCKNWPEAKDWCTGDIIGYSGGSFPGGYPVYDTEWYYCTVAIDMNSDASCN